MRILLILLTLTPGLATTAGGAEARPNVVFLLADDLGREDCGFMGGTTIRTPNIDKLAAAGAKLDAFYALPVCSPTRAALMTGRYPMRHGLQVGVVRPWAQYGLPLEERTLAQALKAAGYRTGIVGKWHLGHFQPEYLPTRRGFDRQYGHYNGALDYFTHERDGGFDWHRDDQICRDEGYATRLLGREAARFIAESAGETPFFLYVPFNAVHSPHQAPPESIAPYGALKGPRKPYAGMLAELDEAIGTIVGAVEKAGVRGNTLFLFSSDNGGPAPGRVTDNGKYRAGKGTLYEGGVRVAAFATWDGHIPAGSTITEPIHMVDWYPTLLNLCGASREQPLPIDGLDVWPTLTQGKPSPHDAILLNSTPRTGAVRVGDWKLVVKNGEDNPDAPAPAASGEESVELFNLRDDPHETTNLADREPARRDALRASLNEFARQAVPPRSRPRPRDFVVPKVWGQFD
ncbi:MAG: arylsulfatase [Isosphaeraceae bacterium]